MLWSTRFALFADATAAESFCWLALPPVETFVAFWVDVAEAVAVCWTGAFWTTVCDCPPPPSPPLCVTVALWLLLLSFCADDDALEELVCSAPLPGGTVESAAALPGANAAQLANKTEHASSARHRLSPSPMSATIADLPSREQTPPGGFDSPRAGGDYHASEVPTRVLVVENHRLVRQGIRSELSGLGFVVTEAATGLDGIAAASEQRPDVVVLDFELPDRPGAEICAAILERHPSAAIVGLSEHDDEASVRAALDAGVRAYLLRNADDLDLPRAIERALAGESVIDPRAAAALLSPRGGEQQPKLSSQELKVLRLVAEGLTNPEIGASLYLSRHTVKEYVSHAMHKLEATNRIEAVRKATALGLIEGVGPPPGETTQSQRDTLVYNESVGPARTTDLKVTPLKIDKLVAGPESPAE